VIGARISLALLAAAFGIAQNLVRPVLAPHVTELGGDAVVVGIVLAAGAIGGLVIAIPIGTLMDRVGSTPVLVAGIAAMVAGGVWMSLATEPFALAAGYVLQGAGGVAVWVPAQAIATVASDQATARRQVATLSTAVLAGQLLGPTIGGVAAQLADTRTAFAISAASAALAAASLLIPGRPSAHVAERATPRRGRTRAQFSRPGYATTLSTSMVAMAVQTTVLGFLPLLLHQLAWGPGEIGVVMSLFGVGSMIARFAFPWIARWLPHFLVTATALVPSGVALALVALAPRPAAIIACVMVAGFSVGLAQPLALLIVARVVEPRERGHAVGMRTFGNRLVQTTLPVVVGGATAVASLGMAFVGVGALAVLAAAVIAGRERRHDAEDPD